LVLEEKVETWKVRWVIRLLLPAKARGFSSSLRPVHGPPSPVGKYLLGGNWLERYYSSPPLSDAEIWNEQRFTSTPSYAFKNYDYLNLFSR
jgi:hypothetical protein